MGGWLAVRSGQADGYKDLNLDLIHLPDGKVEHLTGLLSPDLAERAKTAPGSLVRCKTAPASSAWIKYAPVSLA